MSFIIPTKSFEKPESGQYFAVLADIVDLGEVTTTYNNQVKKFPAVRFVWILNVNGKDGKPLQVQQRFNVTSLHEKSNVYKTLKQILGTPPPQNLDIETLIGQTRLLWINREKSADGTKDFANVMGILPAMGPNGPVSIPVPADYIRVKNRPVTTAGPNGQPAQTYTTPQAAQASAQYNPPVSMPAQQSNVPPAFQGQGSDIKF